MKLGRQCASLIFASALAACGSGAGSPSVPASSLRTGVRAISTPISHVIFIVQENRSFNNLFLGYPGATTRRYGYDSEGNRVGVVSQPLSTTWDIDHFSRAFFEACDGAGKLPGTHCKMDGWDKEFASPGAPHDAMYSYVPRDEIAPYWTLARQYVLADRMFSSNLDGSFIAHQYVVAAYADRGVDYPGGVWGCWGGKSDVLHTLTKERGYGPTIVACFDIATLGQEADAAGVSWRFYTGAIQGDGGLWSSYQADRRIFRRYDWKHDVVSPPSQFLTDIQNGKLANVTWITPTYATSDHPGLRAAFGPAWIASLVDAVGQSKFWQSSAIFITWDDWGGFFDSVKPVFEDYDGLGFRVPLIVVSPYARQNYVTHVQYETSSVLRYVEDNFGLQPLAQSDARANDPANDAFDYTQKPRKFVKISGSEPYGYWRTLDRRWDPSAARRIIGDD